MEITRKIGRNMMGETARFPFLRPKHDRYYRSKPVHLQTIQTLASVTGPIRYSTRQYLQSGGTYCTDNRCVMDDSHGNLLSAGAKDQVRMGSSTGKQQGIYSDRSVENVQLTWKQSTYAIGSPTTSTATSASSAPSKMASTAKLE